MAALQIAKQYLDPKIRKELGLQPDHTSTPPTLAVQDSAIEALIRWYCRESGVRNLEKHIEKLYRKVAYKVASRVEEVVRKLKAAGVTAGPVSVAGVDTPAITPDAPQSPAVTAPAWAKEELPAHAPAAVPPVPVGDAGSSGTAAASAAAAAVAELDPVKAMGLSTEQLFPPEEDWSISDKNLAEYVGKPIFTSDRCVPFVRAWHHVLSFAVH